MSAAQPNMFDVFGDESAGLELVSYGVLVVPDNRLDEANALLVKIEADFGGSEDQKLHCRELFNGHLRAKSPWAQLKQQTVFELYEALAVALRRSGLRRIVTIARKSHFPKTLPQNGTWPEIILNDKQLTAFCGNAVMIPLSKDPGLEKVRFWADPDHTSIEWLGARRKATSALNMFIDVGPGNEPPKVQVANILDEKPALLEVADFVAYAAQRGLSRKYGTFKQRYKNLYALLAPEQLVFTRGRDGGFGIEVPSASFANST